LATGKKPEEMTRTELVDELERLRSILPTDPAADAIQTARESLELQNRELAKRLRELERSEQRERELEELLREGEKMSAIGRLAGAIAHDFNNHLTVILTHAELMAEADLPHALTPHVEEVLQSAERARKLVRQLTTFSRRQPLRVEVVDARELLSGMTRMLDTLCGERVKLHVTARGDGLLLRIDPTHFEQMIVNLVANARDALPKGGNIWVTAAPDDGQGRASVAVEAGELVELTVRDDGTGMAEATRAQAFEPFFTTKPRGVGTGIGLATVYGLARQYDGTATIDSALGRGTTVRLAFPKASARRSGERPATGEAPIEHRTARVLVVEDQPSIRRILTRILERDGHDVLIAGSAEEALTLAEQHPFDLLLTDVVMPGASGRELADQLRATRPDLPVLFTSGAEEGERLGDRAAFVQKPFKMEQLRRAVQQLLARSAGAATPKVGPKVG